MYHYAAKQLNQRQLYKFLTGAIVPRPIAWITTYNPEIQVVNLAPFSYFTILSSRVPLVMVSINRKPDGHPKDTAQNLLNSPKAIIQVVSEDLLVAMNQTAASLPATTSELDQLGLATAPSGIPELPALVDAKIRLHVTHHQHQLLTDDSGNPMTDIFYLRVTDFYFADEVFDREKEYLLNETLAPISRLAGNDYGHLGKVESLNRPL